MLNLPTSVQKILKGAPNQLHPWRPYLGESVLTNKGIVDVSNYFRVAMHISGKIMIPLGIFVIIIGGVMMYWGTSAGVSNFEEARIYEGSDGEMELSGYSEDAYLVVVMRGEYADGKDSVGFRCSIRITYK